jgi:hypothetical protein
MKKLFVVFVAAAFCFGAVSCKKDCTCALTGNEAFDEMVKGIPGFQTEWTYEKISKSDCDAIAMPTLPENDWDLKWNCKQ